MRIIIHTAQEWPAAAAVASVRVPHALDVGTFTEIEPLICSFRIKSHTVSTLRVYAFLVAFSAFLDGSIVSAVKFYLPVDLLKKSSKRFVGEKVRAF